MRITYQSALHLSLPQIAELHSAAYNGWKSDPIKLADIFRIQGVDLQLSLIAYDWRHPVGLALLGRRRAHGWLYDFAITPSHRGQGLGTRLLTTTTREAAKAGVRDIELDVWEKRDDAIRLYERAGFQRVRFYLNFEATGADLGLDPGEIPANWNIRPCTVEEIIPWYAAAHSEPEPCWDRRLPSLLTYGDARACILSDAEGPAACLHYVARHATATDPHRVRPMFIGLRHSADRAHIRALLIAAARDNFTDLATIAFRVALEPDGSTVARLLPDVGLHSAGRAIDMRLHLPEAPTP